MAYSGGTATRYGTPAIDGVQMWGNPDTDCRGAPHVTWNWTGQYYFIDGEIEWTFGGN
jgi:hypothetical protein